MVMIHEVCIHVPIYIMCSQLCLCKNVFQFFMFHKSCVLLCVCVFFSSPEVSSEISIAFSASLPIDTCMYSMCY